MGFDLHLNEEERELFLRALREYSESCEPPGLTPDCPFSEPSAPGVRGCGEECMDLLGKHNAPDPSEVTHLGGGISIRRSRRPRARRTPDKATRAFDAREIFLDDQASSEPFSRWRLASVLYGLIEEAARPPSADMEQAAVRSDRINEMMAEAERRGLTFEAHILPHLRPAIGGGVFAWLMSSPRQEEPSSAFSQAGAWLSLASNHVDFTEDGSPPQASSEELGALLGLTMGWAMSANAENLVNWVPPASRLFEEQPDLATSPDDDGTWIFERFTKTYLKDWTLPALRREWKYLHGQHDAPCPPTDMRVRKVSEPDLAMVMADRLAAEVSPPTEPPSDLAEKLVVPAVNFIEEGRRMEAAALFEAAVHNEPHDPASLNNLGFCLLPDHPARALEYLERAAAAGHGDSELYDANRILALVSSGRYTSAIDLATAYLERHETTASRASTWLWAIDSVLEGDTPELIEYRNLRDYVEDDPGKGQAFRCFSITQAFGIFIAHTTEDREIDNEAAAAIAGRA